MHAGVRSFEVYTGAHGATVEQLACTAQTESRYVLAQPHPDGSATNVVHASCTAAPMAIEGFIHFVHVGQERSLNTLRDPLADINHMLAVVPSPSARCMVALNAGYGALAPAQLLHVRGTCLRKASLPSGALHGAVPRSVDETHNCSKRFHSN